MTHKPFCPLGGSAEKAQEVLLLFIGKILRLERFQEFHIACPSASSRSEKDYRVAHLPRYRATSAKGRRD
jgi:hypothetical protein